MATWDDVTGVASGLPEALETSPRVWKVRKKLFVWERPLRKSDLAALGDSAPDGDILGVGDEGVKRALIAEEPQVYLTTPHFDGYPIVLARLDAISPPDLTQLITEAWLCQAPKTLARRFLD
ncbi:MmcQ/YjbR family DNA-binding protein [Mycobacteroides salmoniphilum]|uniref:MmcQ/YjbR family DNA-binding protein n=1 Tax=Mycobacteroides salmoniphilum TaxID=404941 RepID=UPI0010664855|nr:MmcQ/YjbR family DNA-binding protein [Mycobacteroides salmoniphilum]